MLETISQKLIGLRVKAARESRPWTQDQLAEGLRLNDRQSVSDIENGKRALKPDELLALTDLLDRDLEFFIDPFVVEGEAQFSWRAHPDMAANGLDGFEAKAGQWIGLLRWLRAQQDKPVSALKQTLRLSVASSYEDAQQRGEDLAAQLDLGVIPAESLIDKVEKQLDIPVLFVDMDEARGEQLISGATCHLEQMGAILINRKEGEPRRFYDLAHELFHALTWEAMKPTHRETNDPWSRKVRSKIERLADHFAAGLLMPRSSLEKLIPSDRKEDVAHLRTVAELLHVSTNALGWRLLNLGWINDDVRLSLVKERTQRAYLTPKLFSLSFVTMLHRALERGRISARKAAKTTGLGLGGLTNLFAEYELSPPFDL
jgi:Zn-dependent peptidase ImmA (M78 family)/DNA-binding XRE family transcriptional regulator